MQENLVIHKIFNQVSDRFADQVALQIKEDSHWRRYSYKEVEELARKVAMFLIELGYDQGDCAVLILENSPEWGIIYLGIMFAGLTCVAIDSELSTEELNNIFQDCRPVVCFSSHSIFKEKINFFATQRSGAVKEKFLNGIEFSSRPKAVVVDSEGFKKIKTQQRQEILWPEVSGSDIASLIYTSGTTARPKGVILTHDNFCANFRSIEKLNICSPKDNFLSILPLYHTYAFMVTFLVPLLTGAKITYARSFKPEDLTALIKEAKITILVGVPQLFSLIHKAIFEKIKKIPFFFRPMIMPQVRKEVRNRFGRSLRFLFSGGARIEAQVGKDLSRFGFKFIEGYGLTETSPIVTLNPPKKPKYGSVGVPIPGVQLRILNPDKSGVGEVLIKGSNVMLGYFKQPDLTAQVKSADGWFNSQDLGYLDKEGYLFLVGRKKDVIVLSSGKNIYPEELEEYYGQSDYIKEICILEKSQKQFGQKVQLLFAVVVPDFEYFLKKKEVSMREKVRWELENLAFKLPTYKRIMGFIITKEELPRTHLKKIKRHEISRRYLSQIAQTSPESSFLTGQEEISKREASLEDGVILDPELTQKIIKYLSLQLNKRVDLDSHLEIDLGIDSLGRVELGLSLESLLSIEIPQEFIERVLTVKELIINMQRVRQITPESSEAQRRKTWSQIINEAPPQEVLAKIRVTSGFLDRMFTWIFKNIFGYIFRLFWFLRIEGKEFIPSQGPYIFCPNHASFLDGFVLFASIPTRSAADLFFIGLAKIFEHSLVAWAVRIARLISIDPITHLTEALQAARFVLSHKKLICVFPEGGRSVDSNIKEFKKGIGILAKELNIPLIPVYIKGSHFAWPRTRMLPRIHPLKIIFGKPCFWQDLGNDYEAIAKGLRKEVLKLKN